MGCLPAPPPPPPVFFGGGGGACLFLLPSLGWRTHWPAFSVVFRAAVGGCNLIGRVPAPWVGWAMYTLGSAPLPAGLGPGSAGWAPAPGGCVWLWVSGLGLFVSFLLCGAVFPPVVVCPSWVWVAAFAVVPFSSVPWSPLLPLPVSWVVSCPHVVSLLAPCPYGCLPSLGAPPCPVA